MSAAACSWAVVRWEGADLRFGLLLASVSSCDSFLVHGHI